MSVHVHCSPVLGLNGTITVPHRVAVAADPSSTVLATDVLREAVEQVADVRVVALPGRAGRLDTTGPRPVLLLAEQASVQDWSRVLLDALKMLILDLPAEHARPVRRLRPVG
jgi:hypothetical protein